MQAVRHRIAIVSTPPPQETLSARDRDMRPPDKPTGTRVGGSILWASLFGASCDRDMNLASFASGHIIVPGFQNVGKRCRAEASDVPAVVGFNPTDRATMRIGSG